MPDINVEELGPVDCLVVGFPAKNAYFPDEMASELKALIDSDTVRLLDLVVLMKSDGGTGEASELCDADNNEVGELRALERDLAALLAEQDVEEIGLLLEPGSTAAVLVFSGRTPGRRRSARQFGGQAVSS